MILKAENSFQAACIIRGLMTMAAKMEAVLVASTFRISKQIIQDLAGDFPEGEVRNDIDRVTLTSGRNVVEARPVRDGHILFRGGVDVLVILPDGMPDGVYMNLTGGLSK